jgi:hypothetical protein
MNRNNVLTEHYEELRQRATGLQPAGVMWGLIVLRTKGMASWARKWQEYIGGDMPQVPLKESTPSASPLSSSGDEVVQVLAGMVWALQKEVGA